MKITSVISKLVVSLLLALAISGITQGAAVEKEITVMMGIPAAQQYIIEEIASRFEKAHPGIKVNMVNGADEKVLTAIASGVIPDVGTINQTQAPGFYRAGMAHDLSAFIKADNFDVSILPPNPESLQWQGRWYGMPQAGNAFGGRTIYYNRDLLSTVGLPSPTHRWTWDEFANYVQKLSLDRNSDGVFDRVGYSFGPLEWPIYLWSGGAEIMNDTHTEFTLTSPAAVDALEFWASLTRRGFAATPIRNFGAEATAMRTGAFFETRTMSDQKLSFDWSIVEFPRGRGGSVNRRGTHPWVIPVGAKHPYEAWQFIKFWLSDEIQSDLVLKWNWRPPQTMTIARQLARMQFDRPPYSYAPFMGVNGTIKALPIDVPNWDQIEAEIGKALNPVWKGEQSVIGAMEALTPKIKSMMK